jgi:hypothetical protein
MNVCGVKALLFYFFKIFHSIFERARIIDYDRQFSEMLWKMAIANRVMLGF